MEPSAPAETQRSTLQESKPCLQPRPPKRPIRPAQYTIAVLPILLFFDSMHFVFARLLAPYYT
ncbi:MAG: hypothetical protein R2932_12920 [Caldilineaceae bacterium]